ncbi:MAG: pyridoxamine 5'-phosphate oxidase family protein [Acidimicrobiales bacterium]
MKTFDSRTGLEWLDRDECLRLLGSDEIGRLAFVDGHAATIVPVNYRMDGDAVVFRSDPGAKLDAGARASVSFEIDSFDRAHRRGWSVVVSGRLEEVTPYDAATYNRVHELPVEPWACGDKVHWVRIVPSRITGRRIG